MQIWEGLQLSELETACFEFVLDDDVIPFQDNLTGYTCLARLPHAVVTNVVNTTQITSCRHSPKITPYLPFWAFMWGVSDMWGEEHLTEKVLG